MSKDHSMSEQPGYTNSPPPYGMTSPGQPVIITQPVMLPPALGPMPCNIQCPSCHASIQTRVVHENTSKTHLFALLLCLIGCWPCAVIPYCTDSCQSANHYCPSCGAYLGACDN